MPSCRYHAKSELQLMKPCLKVVELHFESFVCSLAFLFAVLSSSIVGVNFVPASASVVVSSQAICSVSKLCL